jgi:hypothetical protein
MQWSEIQALSAKTGVHCNTIKWRLNRGLTGPELVKPPKPGNYQITAKQAKAIWQDLQRLVASRKPKTHDITQMVANKHRVAKTLVNNIRHGRTWNGVTGLPRKKYD